MTLRPGQKLHSAVCDAQVVVVRAPAVEVELGCGGAPLLEDGEDASGATLDPELAGGVAMGKRYADDELGLELLVSRAGAGTLTCNGTPLELKGAKPLPASD